MFGAILRWKKCGRFWPPHLTENTPFSPPSFLTWFSKILSSFFNVYFDRYKVSYGVCKVWGDSEMQKNDTFFTPYFDWKYPLFTPSNFAWFSKILHPLFSPCFDWYSTSYTPCKVWRDLEVTKNEVIFTPYFQSKWSLFTPSNFWSLRRKTAPPFYCPFWLIIPPQYPLRSLTRFENAKNMTHFLPLIWPKKPLQISHDFRKSCTLFLSCLLTNIVCLMAPAKFQVIWKWKKYEHFWPPISTENTPLWPPPISPSNTKKSNPFLMLNSTDTDPPMPPAQFGVIWRCKNMTPFLTHILTGNTPYLAPRKSHFFHHKTCPPFTVPFDWYCMSDTPCNVWCDLKVKK